MSTYHPMQLGTVEVKILSLFAEHGVSFSVYQIFNRFKQEAEIREAFLSNSGDPETLQTRLRELTKKFDDNTEIRNQVWHYFLVAQSKSVTPFIKELMSSPASYKNTHKRIRRLVELKLIEQSHVHLRGAIHYKITACGLVAFFNHVIPEDPSSIRNNMNK